MKWKIIRIYLVDLKAETRYQAMREFLELEQEAPIEPSDEFATFDRPKPWWSQLVGK